MKESILKEKSKSFAIRIIRFYQTLKDAHQEFVLSKQILRSGTSIGANIAEAFYAESEMDFIHKLSIAQKECSETLYWLDILYATQHINEVGYNSLNTDATEIMKLLTSSIKTVKNKLNHQSLITKT